jgi:hypothetical protein
MNNKLKALKDAGCTNARLREIFTAELADADTSEDEKKQKEKDVKIRKKIQERIESRVSEGIEWSCKHSRFYQAVDLAWDSTPIQKETVPLLLYAQGKIDKVALGEDLKSLSCANQFLDVDTQGQIKDINLPKLYEVSISIIRSYITRRVMAQSARFTNLWTFFKFDPRGTRPVDKLYADLISQRVEIMTDQFGYRRLFAEQSIRDMFLYGHSVVFPTQAWTTEKEWVAKQVPESVFNPETPDYESRIKKEGVVFIKPHPTRVFWDRSAPLSQVNTDTGPRYIGYWDVVRYRDICDTIGYFNRDHVEYSTALTSTSSAYQRFFQYYFDPTMIKFPSGGFTQDFNDNKTMLGVYSAEKKDQALFLTQYFEKINPKAEGIGDYPYDTWVRYVVASDNTVIGAEWLPSIPACYGGVNENDDRVVNASMAHELMPFQDQLTNIFSQMLMNMKNSLLQLWFINEDVLDDESKEYVKSVLRSDQYYVNPKALFYSGSKLMDMGMNPDQAVKIVQANLQEKITDALRAISQVLSLVERLLIFSPQELGQAAPREISASEVVEISNTTNSIYSFIADGIDYQREAVKKIIYESMLCCAKQDIKISTLHRYPRSVIEEAGLTDDDVEKGSIRRRVSGYLERQDNEVLFSSRDGMERVNNTSAAQTLTQLIGQMVQIPQVLQAMGNEKLFEIFNEIFRLAGASDILLEVPQEEAQPALEDRVAQLEQMLMQATGQGQPPQGGAPAQMAQPQQPPPSPQARTQVQS